MNSYSYLYGKDEISVQLAGGGQEDGVLSDHAGQVIVPHTAHQLPHHQQGYLIVRVVQTQPHQLAIPSDNGGLGFTNFALFFSIENIFTPKDRGQSCIKKELDPAQ